MKTITIGGQNLMMSDPLPAGTPPLVTEVLPTSNAHPGMSMLEPPVTPGSLL